MINGRRRLWPGAAGTPSKLKQAAELMDAWIADGRVPGRLHPGDAGAQCACFARNFGTAKGTDPVFLLASISKPMTAAAVMSLGSMRASCRWTIR